MSPRFITLYCGLLLALSAISNDVMLPALFAIHAEIGGQIERIQLVFPVFVLVSAVGQLAFGASSDRFGRRPTLIAGLGFYMLGSTLAMTAGGIVQLLAGRALQGLGSACGQVVGRAVLRDTHHGLALASAMALAMAIFALGPILAPLIGYGLVAIGSWRAAFLVKLTFGAAMLALAVLVLKETNSSPDKTALQPARLIASVGQVWRHPQSRFFLIVASLIYFCILSYVTNAPRLFRSEFGIDGAAFALLFSFTGLGLVVTQIANSRLLQRYGTLATTRGASAVMVSAASMIALLSLTGLLSGLVFVALVLAFNSAFLVVFANSASLVIDPHKEIAGLASSIFGAVTQLFGSLMMLLTLPLFRGAMVPWSLTILVVSTIVISGLMLYKPGQTPTPQPSP